MTLDDDTVFVHPSSGTDGDEPEDALVRGRVVLSLPKRRALHSIRVHLEGICDAQGILKYLLIC